MKKLIILDLDNTLIYASFYKLPANILFKYSDYLTIYERPHAKEFIKKCLEEIGLEDLAFYLKNEDNFI